MLAYSFVCCGWREVLGISLRAEAEPRLIRPGIQEGEVCHSMLCQCVVDLGVAPTKETQEVGH